MNQVNTELYLSKRPISAKNYELGLISSDYRLKKLVRQSLRNLTRTLSNSLGEIVIVQENYVRINPYWQISGTFLRPFFWKTHPPKKHEYLFSFLKNRVVSWTVLLENSSNRQLENSGASHRPFNWKTHPKESI